MSQIVEGRRKSFTAGLAIARCLRVKLTASKLAIAGASDAELGTLEDAVFADLDIGVVNLRTLQGTAGFVANGAITKGVTVYGAASGKISATAGPVVIGIALEAATADGDIIEVLRGGGVEKTVSGQATTVAAVDTIVTGLATVTSVVVSMEADPGDDPFMCSAQIGDQAGAPAAGSFYLKTWKNTGGTDPTPLAATTFSKKVNWIARGT